MLAIIIMVCVVILLKLVMPLNLASTLSCILYVAVIAIIGAITYLVVAWKLNLIKDVLGESFVKKIIKKLTFGKVS